MSDWQDTKDIIKAIMISIGYVIIASMLFSCKSSHTLTHKEQKKLEVFTNISNSADTLNALRKQLDDMQHKTMSMDSLIAVLKERELERKITNTKEFLMLRDSMSVSMDSLGNFTYRYWSWSDKREEVHDTLWRDRVVESDTRRVSILRDSINIYKEKLDSMNNTSIMRDSIYQALLDSINEERITEKKQSVVSRAADGVTTIAVTLLIILAVTVAIQYALKK